MSCISAIQSLDCDASARTCKASPSSISLIASGRHIPTHRFALRIADALDLPVTFTLRKAGLLPRGEPPPAKQELIALVKKLPERDVRALLDLLKASRT